MITHLICCEKGTYSAYAENIPSTLQNIKLYKKGEKRKSILLEIMDKGFDPGKQHLNC